jgi:hypothetical protein
MTILRFDEQRLPFNRHMRRDTHHYVAFRTFILHTVALHSEAWTAWRAKWVPGVCFKMHTGKLRCVQVSRHSNRNASQARNWKHVVYKEAEITTPM